MTLTPTARNLFATVVVLGLLVAAVGAAVFSSYTSVARNEDNRFTAGTIALTDNDAGSSLFTVAGFTPGDTFTRCLKVSYASTGGVESGVRLYGTTGGDGLANFLTLRIRRGVQPGGAPAGACSGFTPDGADYNGLGPGVVVDDDLGAFPTDYDGGIRDPVASWKNGDEAVYEISMGVKNDNAAQGLSATQDFSFEARTL